MSLKIFHQKMIKLSRQLHIPNPIKRIFVKSILLFGYLVLIITTELFSLPVDPFDEIYRYLDLWRKKGYIVSLPTVWPYPHQVLINLLGQVENFSDTDARKNA